MNIFTFFVQLFSTIWFFTFALAFTMVISILVLPGALLPLKPRLRYVDQLWRLYGLGIIRIGLLARVHTNDLRSPGHKKTPSPGIYISNHTSQMDIPLMLTRSRVPPIMKKEVLYIPIVGFVGYASGAMPVDRSSAKSRKRVVTQTIERLKSGVGIQYYPEGTRNRESSSPKAFEKIRPKLLRLAYQNNLPVTAVSIFGTKNTFKGFLVNPFQKVGITLKKEVYPGEFKDEDEFGRYCWKLVQDGYNEMESLLTKSQ